MVYSKKILFFLSLSSLFFVKNVYSTESCVKFLSDKNNYKNLTDQESLVLKKIAKLDTLFSKTTEKLMVIKVKDTLVYELEKGFEDLCLLLSQIEKPKKHHIREINLKIDEISQILNLCMELTNQPADVTELVEGIKEFVTLIKDLINDSNLNLGSFSDEMLDVLFYLPLDLVKEHKLAVAISGGLVLSGLAGIITYNLLEKNEKEKAIDNKEINSKILDIENKEKLSIAMQKREKSEISEKNIPEEALEKNILEDKTEKVVSRNLEIKEEEIQKDKKPSHDYYLRSKAREEAARKEAEEELARKERAENYIVGGHHLRPRR